MPDGLQERCSVERLHEIRLTQCGARSGGNVLRVGPQLKNVGACPGWQRTEGIDELEIRLRDGRRIRDRQVDRSRVQRRERVSTPTVSWAIRHFAANTGRSGRTAYRLPVALEQTTTSLTPSTSARIPVELATDRTIRYRNKLHYRLSHWPIWIWVFFLAPGPLTFDLFESGFDSRMAAWLGVVLLATGTAGLRGQLPGVEPRPYIIRFTEDRPNPLYRRICYTFAWSAVITFAVLNVAGLITALTTGDWYLRQLYDAAYFPIAVTIWVLGALGQLPRVRSSTKGEGHERRYFYGSVWAVCIAQPVLWFLYAVLPQTTAADAIKLAVFIGILVFVGWLSYRGKLPRTRPIVPGELAVSD